MQPIYIKNLHKTYKSYVNGQKLFTKIYDDFNLIVKKGELLSVFGPNGCGKTTLLNIIANLTDFDSGEVHFSEDTSRDKVKIGYVFQNYSDTLFPWKANIDNIAFPLELKGMRRIEYRHKAKELLRKLQIDIPEYFYPYQISSGQKQLVTIARALMYEPDILLMDEPFVGLDYHHRTLMQDKVLDIWHKTGVTLIFVSHEIEEAIYLGNRTIVLSRKPMRILKDISINFPQPRNQKIKESYEFYLLKKDIAKIFREEIKKDSLDNA